MSEQMTMTMEPILFPQMATTNSSPLELRMYDTIGMGGISAKAIVEQLAKTPTAPVTVRINSTGGSIFEGVAIYNALLGHKGSVTVRIEGIAASIASVVAMAGNKIQIAKSAWIMIHNPMDASGSTADSSELRRAADTLDKLRDSVAGTYARRTKKPVKEIVAMMDAETWFNADEAVAAGFADEIIEDGPVNRAATFINCSFNKIPDPVRKMWGLPEHQAPVDSPRSEPEPVALTQENPPMDSTTTTVAPAQPPAAGLQGNSAGDNKAEDTMSRQIAGLKEITNAGYIEQGKKIGAEEARKQERDRLAEIMAACPGNPRMALEAFMNGQGPESVKLAFEAEARADARAREMEKAKDLEISRLNALIANGGHPGVALALAGMEDEQPRMEPKAQAEWEWEHKPSVRKTARTKDIYVLARTAELDGTHRSFSREPAQV